jgi:hypothetical protein
VTRRRLAKPRHTGLRARIRYASTIRAVRITRHEVGRRRYVFRVELDGLEYGVTFGAGVERAARRAFAELVLYRSKGFFCLYAARPEGLNDGGYLGRATLITSGR